MDTPSDRVQMVWAEAQQLTRYLHALPPASWHHPGSKGSDEPPGEAKSAWSSSSHCVHA